MDDSTLFARYTGINTSLIAHIVISSDNILESCSGSRIASLAVSMINSYLTVYGVPDKSLLTNDEFVLAGITIVITLVLYYFLMGKGHVKKRRRLAADLKIAQEKVHFLEDRLMLFQVNDEEKKGGDIRIFMDGAFDMMHYGHMNAFRLARSLGTHLIVGVNSDKSITQCKGPPLMNDDERLSMVKGCRFVDEALPECPYVMNAEYLDYIIKEHKIDYVIHGDDPCIVDGKDVYEAAKNAGKYQSIPRTEGVSTTDIVGRMLLMNKDHHYNSSSANKSLDGNTLLCEQSKFLTTSRMLRLFSAGMKSPKSGMKVIYIDGAWDMFHCGHIAILEAAKKRGDYLIVGIHGDAVVNRERGYNLPLMNLHERVLSVLGCKFVDDVLIDAPQLITPQMVQSLNINEIVHGSKEDDLADCTHEERYKYAKSAGIYVQLESPSKFSLANIISRIRQNQAKFEAKIARKKQAEDEFYKEKYNQVDTE